MPKFRVYAGLALVVGLVAIGLALLSRNTSSSKPNPSELLKQLTNRHFKSLDAELSSYQRQFEKDPAREMRVIVAFAVFDTSKAMVDIRTAEWVKAEPDSYAAALAHAESLTATARQWRGNGWASSVTPRQWKKVHLFFNQARSEAKRAISIDPHLAAAYALLIEAARVDGSEAEVVRAAEQALHRVPQSFEVRKEIIVALMPRWGGSREAMVKFAEASQAYAHENPTIAFLKAWPTIDDCERLEDQRNWKAAAHCYTHAIDESGEYWLPYYRRADDYFWLGKFKLSTRDAMHAEALFPMQSDSIELLAYDTERLNRPGASIRWISDYTKFNTPDSNMRQLLQIDQRRVFYRLTNAGVAAFKAGKFDKAERDAQELLSDAPKFRNNWNYGNAIFKGNMIIGLVALKRDNNVARADSALLASAKQPGSPQLESFGPNMTLAQALLERGQRKTVLAFLADCRNFWKVDQGRIDAWSKTIKAGGTPDFGSNLRY